jgi:hypothetical protein
MTQREVLAKEVREFFTGRTKEGSIYSQLIVGCADVIISALKEWAGSGLLTNDEAKTIILKHCSPETRPNDIIITEIERDLIEAQALRDKLEYEGKMQELFTGLDDLFFPDDRDEYIHINRVEYQKLKAKYGGKQMSKACDKCLHWDCCTNCPEKIAIEYRKEQKDNSGMHDSDFIYDSLEESNG